MRISDAKPGDVYVDKGGKLWRVTAVYGEPSIAMQEIEPLVPASPITQMGIASAPIWRDYECIWDGRPARHGEEGERG